jgi:TonB family protein
MREIINYMVEANLALLMFLAAYKVMLRNENNFRFMRTFLLLGILIAVSFPLFEFNGSENTDVLSVSNVLPEHWLPEVTVGAIETAEIGQQTNVAYNQWRIAGWIYISGVVVFAMIILFQIRSLLKTFRLGEAYQLNNFRIIESTEDKPTFSFFHMIYIGRADTLTSSEKQQVIRHETVHASQLHSFDILVVTLLRIAFWFNPFINTYKKTFIQLHEFEADARAVEDSDVNKYCSLLARVALQSVDFPIASHFNQSLTLKRIEMMKTIRRKIKPWKIAVLAAVIPVIFFAVACQDQVNEIAKSTVIQTSNYPPEVKAHMDEYMKKHPDAKLTYMEGLPDEVDKLLAAPQVQDKVIYEYSLKREEGMKKGVLMSNIVQHAESLKTDDQVFMVVEHQPEFPGGFDALRNFIRDNMKYPQAAAAAKIEGVVYISFVINTDGSVSDTKVLRGIEATLDQEALRVVSMFPNWIPGKQNGKAVRVRFNIPIKFGLGYATGQAQGINADNAKMKLSYTKSVVDGKTIIQGTVMDDDQNGLAGANILVKGTTKGTTTDLKGNFKLEVPPGGSELVFSFVGFDSQTVSF